MEPNVSAGLSYLVGIIGIIFFFMEKQNRFVRFHAAQSITVGVALIAVSIVLSILSTVLAFIPVLGWIVAILLSLGLGLGSFVLWIMLMWRAWQGREWETPVAGSFARRIAA